MIDQALHQPAAGIDVDVAAQEDVEGQRFALIGLILHELPGVAVEGRKSLGRIPVEGGHERPGRFGPARGQYREHATPATTQSTAATVQITQPRSQSQSIPRPT